MKINRHLIIKSAMVLFLAAYLSLLCVSDSVKNVPMDTIAASMESGTNITSLTKRGRTDLRRFYQISDTDGFLFYKAISPMAVNEILIVKAKDKKQADAFLENAQAHLDSQISIFESYGTDQMALLNNAMVESHGNYVFYMCGSDAASWRQAFLSLI